MNEILLFFMPIELERHSDSTAGWIILGLFLLFFVSGKLMNLYEEVNNESTNE
jgi:hypothetical protein